MLIDSFGSCFWNFSSQSACFKLEFLYIYIYLQFMIKTSCKKYSEIVGRGESEGMQTLRSKDSTVSIVTGLRVVRSGV
jgi:hypothetical protein